MSEYPGGSSATDIKAEHQKKIEELLTLIGGSEVVLSTLQLPEDYKLQREILKVQTQKLKELRAIVYGLPVRP